MGLNAQTSVPTFTTGQVLTAAQQNNINTGIPVFADSTARDAAFGGTGEKVLAEGQYAYIEATNVTQYYDGAAWQPVGGGLNLVTKTAFTTTATWVLDNIFTSAYDNYRIDIVWTQLTSTANYAGFQMRVGGVAATAANYQYAMLESNNAGATNRYSTSSSRMPVLDSTSGDILVSGSSFTVLKPFTAQATTFLGQFIGVDVGLRGMNATGFHNVATSYDGIQVANDSTASGTVYVYGLAK